MGLSSSMRKYFNRCFSAAEENIHTFSEPGSCSCSSLWMLISPVIPAVILTHAISLGDWTLFSKGNEKVSLRPATKFLQLNRKKLSQLLGGCSPAFPLAGPVAQWTRAALCRSCPAVWVPPSHTQPLRAVYLLSCWGYRAGRADAGLHPPACWANKQLGFSPIPSLSQGWGTCDRER